MSSPSHLPVSPRDSSSQKSEQAYHSHSYVPEMSDTQYTSRSSTTPLRMALDWLKSLILPALAAAYLALCYVAYKDIVPITGRGIFDDSPKNIAKVKSGITTISILVIAITVWPCRSLLQDIRSEEFFRTLSTHKAGVPLATVNNISTPSYSTFSALLAIIRRRCSGFFSAAILGGFLLIAVTSLAPAILSAEVMLFDGDLVAFSVGELSANALFNTTDTDSMSAFLFGSTIGSEGAEEAASMAWAQASLGVSSAFKAPEPDLSTNKRYIVPVPKELNKSMSARWLTNVMSISPSCTFPRTNITENISQPTSNLSSVLALIPTIKFPDIDLAIKSSNIGSGTSTITISQIEGNEILNGTSGDMDTNGASVWSLSQCVEGCRSSTNTASMSFNMSGLPTFRVTGMDSLSNASTTIEATFLACLPRADRETREVRVDDQGNLFVEPLPTGYRLTNQRNIDLIQGRILMNVALSKLGTNGGPTHNSALGIGSVAQVNMILPEDKTSQGSWRNRTSSPIGAVHPLSEKEISENYGKILQSAASTFFVSGKTGRANVPARVYYPSLVFTASLPHIIASTAIFGILALLMLVAQFRQGKGESFTLYSVGKTLHQSDLPAQFSSISSGKGMGDVHRRTALRVGEEDEVMKALGDRKVVLRKGFDGLSPMLSFSH